MSIQNLAVVFGQIVFGQVGRGNINGSMAGHGNGNGRRSISEQGDYPAIFFFSFSTLMFIIATFTGDRDDIKTLL